MIDPSITQQVMDSLGGNKFSHKDGDCWIFISGEFAGKFEPFIRKSTSKQSVGVDISITHTGLSELARAITGEKSGSWQQIEWCQCIEETASDADIPIALMRVVSRD
jgi:hypothetical protein